MIDVNENMTEFIVSFPYDQQRVEKVKQFAGRQWDSIARHWSVPVGVDVEQTAAALQSALGLQLTARVIDAIKSHTELNAKIESMVNNDYPFLREFQKVAVIEAAKKKRFLISDEMGLGKSCESIVVADVISKLYNYEKVLIVCPASIRTQWQSEIKKFIGIDAIILDKAKIFGQGYWMIINYEKLIRAKDLDSIGQNAVVIADEASKIKNLSTQRSRAMTQLMSKATAVILLTGTPVENSLKDVHTLISYLNPSLVTQRDFNKNYCMWDQVQVGWGTHARYFNKIVGFKNVDEFKNKIALLMIRRIKKEVAAELPEKIIETRIIPLSKEQSRIHGLITNAVDENDEKYNALAKLTLAHMTSNSTMLVNNSDSDTWKSLGIAVNKFESAKIEELKDIIEDTTGQILVFTKFASFANEIAAEIHAPCLIGGTRQHEMTATIDAFKRNAFRVLVTTDCLAYGVSLPNVEIVVNADIPWNPAILKQRGDRAHRLDSKHNVTIINFVSEGIEQHVWNIVSEKQDLFNSAIGEMDIAGMIINKLKEGD